MQLRIQLLGTVDIHADAQALGLGSTKERLLLAALAWHAGQPVSDDILVDRLWGDSPLPADPVGMLSSLTSRIRRRPDRAGLAGSHIPLARRDGTYTLRVDREIVDLHQCLALFARAHRLLADGKTDAALSCLDAADALWSGEPLAGLPGTWPEFVRREVGEHVAAATGLRTETALRQRRYAEAVGLLGRAVQEAPANEELARQYALALHGAGRSEEASRWLQQTTRLLHTVFGGGPGPELRRVHEGILAGTPAGVLFDPQPPTVTMTHFASVPDNLPPDALWAGREAQVQHLTRTAEGTDAPTGAVTITGMPGAGKTALAVHVAHLLTEGFPDGRLFVDLRGHAVGTSPMSPAEALTELLRLLGEREDLPSELHSLLALWRATTRERRLLAVLDDAVDADQLQPLLPSSGSPTLILATSRKTLTGLPTTRHTALDELDLQDAVALLERVLGERAGTTQELTELADICERLPLALDIAANRLLSRPSWTTADLLHLLRNRDSRLPELRDGRREISHVFAVSYNALAPTQQRAFHHLALHPGVEFDARAAAALVGLSLPETERVLEELLTAHLLNEPTPHRYRFHDLLREYARSLPAEETADVAALHRLAALYLHLADAADRQAAPHRARFSVGRHLAPVDPDLTAEHHWVQTAYGADWLRKEQTNLVAMLDHAWQSPRSTLFAELAHVLADLLRESDDVVRGGAALADAIAFWRSVDEDFQLAHALVDFTEWQNVTGAYAAAAETAHEALDLTDGNGALAAAREEALHQLSITGWHLARHQEAETWQRRALELRLARGDRLQQARSFNILGMLALELAHQDEAESHFLEALTRFEEVHDEHGSLVIVNNLAELAVNRDDLVTAELRYRRALENPKARIPGKRAVLETNLANVLSASGRGHEAETLLHRALPTLRHLGDQRDEVAAQLSLSKAMLATGRDEAARDHLVEVLRRTRALRVRQEEIEALVLLGHAERGLTDDAADRHLLEAAQVADDTGLRSPLTAAQTFLTRLAEQQHSGHGET